MKFVVIGATQGLGLSLVKELLSAGHTVAAGVVDRTPPKALEDLCLSFPKKLMVFKADVTDEKEIEAGALLCKDFLREADSLCNVAGVLLKGDRTNLIHNVDVDELRKTFAVNALGPVIVGKYFYPIMKKGGSLLTVTSEGVAIKSCGTWVPCYGLSKAAATKVSGIFNASVSDVDFYSVHPGRMNTEMGKTTAQIEPEESAKGFYKLMTGETAMSRDSWYIDYNGNTMEA